MLEKITKLSCNDYPPKLTVNVNTLPFSHRLSEVKNMHLHCNHHLPLHAHRSLFSFLFIENIFKNIYERIFTMTFTNLSVVPHSLLVYETLLSRKNGSAQEKQYYERLRKGFLGEIRLAKLVTEGNFEKILPLYNCLFEVDGAEFQIDCLLITSDMIFLLEVKNYARDYYIENNKLFNFETKKEIYNPITQLERTEYLFKKLLDEMRINIQVQPYVVFINPEFMVYGATPRLPMIFPPQVRRFLQKVNANASVLTNHTGRLLSRLKEKRKERSSYKRLPKYDISQLKRGVFCERCYAELERENQYTLICSHCQKKYSLDDAILFAVAQFHLLFPMEKITRKSVNDWCGGTASKSYVSDFLQRELNHVKRGPYSYSEFKNKNEHISILLRNYKDMT